MSTLATLTVKLVGDVSDFTQKMQGVEGTVNNVGKTMTGVGSKMTLGITAPIVGLGVAAANTAADFESQMNILQIAAKDSGLSMDALSESAIRVGGDTRLVGIDAVQAADAMTNFYKAGLDTTDMFGDLNSYMTEGTELTGAMRAAVDLQAASELDLASASELVAIAMATYGLEADDASMIANSFVQSADASVTSVQELYDAMANIGPTAAAFGFSLGETNTALAILSERGIRGSEAGTALKSMLTNMMRDTDEVTGSLEELGVSIYDLDGNMRSLPEIIADLDSGLSGLTEEQRNQYIQTIAGTYGMKAMQTLLAEGASGWDEMTGKIADAATAQESMSARTQGLNSATEQLQGVLQTLMIQVGTPIIENFLTPMVQKLTDLASWFSNLPAPVMTVIIVILALLAAVGPLLVIVGTLITSVTAIIPVLTAVAGVITGPVLLAIAAAIAIIALLAAAWKNNWGGIRDKVNEVVSWIKSFIPQAMEFIRDVVNDVLAAMSRWWSEHGDSVMTIVNAALSFAKNFIDGAMKFIQDIVNNVLTFVSDLWAKHGDEIMKFASDAWEGIKATVEEITGIIGDIIDAIAAAISGDWKTFGEELRSAWDSTWDLIKKALETAKEIIFELIGNLVDTIIEIITETDWLEVGGNIIRGLADGITGGLEIIRDAAIAAAKAAIEAAKGFLGIESPSKAFAEIGANIALGLVEGIRTNTDAVINETLDMVDGVLNIAGKVSSLGAAFASRFDQKFLTPLTDSLDVSRKNIEAWFVANPMFASFKDFSAADLNRAIRSLPAGILGEEADALRDLLPLLKTRDEIQNQINAALIEQSRLERAQADLDYLRSQLDLLKLISDNGLDAADILGGLALGIDANAGDLANAMTRALEAMVAKAQEELGIHSPSTVFRQIGRNLMSGLTLGVSDGSAIEDAMGRVALAASRPFANTSGRAAPDPTGRAAYNLTIYSNSPAEDIVDDFGVMKSWGAA